MIRPFNDSGVYMMHRHLTKVSSRPTRIRVTNTDGGFAVGNVSDWLRDVAPLTADPNYKWNFINEYKHPQQLYSRFREIAAANPEIAEIVELPNKTNGYQRKAQAIIGRRTIAANRNAAVNVTSVAWGHEGGNGITVETVNRPGHAICRCPSRSTTARSASCWPRTRAARSPAPRHEVAAAIEAAAPGLIANAHKYRNEPGTGIVQATAAAGRAERLPGQAHVDARRSPRPRARCRAGRPRSRCCASA